MEKEPKVMVLIDSNAIIHRSYHALPKTMSTSKGELTNVIYGYTTTLLKVLEDLKPDYIAASFDISRATFRMAEYSEYKATRIKADQELYDQIPKVRELLSVLNIPIYELEGFEADDCIGTISDKFEDNNPKQIYKDCKVYIVTGDKDTFQLVDDNIFIYNLKGGLSNIQITDRDAIMKDWGLHPEDFVDLKALAGDPSDNIPGVPGIGPKTAIDLLQKFDSLDKLYVKIKSLTHNKGLDEAELKKIAAELQIKPRALQLLIDYEDQAEMSQSLATIRRDVPLDFDLDKCKWGDYDKEALKNFFERMQFHSLLRRFGAERATGPKTEAAEEQKIEDNQLSLL